MPFCEDICILTGKVVPYLAQKECFVAKVEQDTKKLTQDNNKMAENANTKVCKVCGKELPIDQFRPNHKSPDGHLNTCKECMGQIQKKAYQNSLKKGESCNIDKAFPETQDKFDRLQEYTPQELVDHLRFQGWDVTCRRVVEL